LDLFCTKGTAAVLTELAGPPRQQALRPSETRDAAPLLPQGESTMPKQTLSLARRALRRRQKESERRLQELLWPVVKVLADTDESRSRAVVEYISRAWLPAVASKLIDRLVGLLGQGGEAARRQAVASVAQFGHPAVPALTLRFRRSRRAAVQLDVVAALQRLAPGLSCNQRINLMAELAILGASAADEAVCLRLAETIAILRASSEPRPRPSTTSWSPK
jgi:hypothetical protein